MNHQPDRAAAVPKQPSRATQARANGGGTERAAQKLYLNNNSPFIVYGRISSARLSRQQQSVVHLKVIHGLK